MRSIHPLSTFFTLLLVSAASAQSLRLVPTPQHVDRTNGTFRITADTRIVLERPDSADDRFAAQQLVDEAKQSLNLDLRIGGNSEAPSIYIGAYRNNRDVQQLAEQLANHDTAPLEGYVLIVQPERIILSAESPAGTFYGVQTLKQLIRANTDANTREIPCCRIVDFPRLRYRAWQDDISRGPIPTMAFLKREIAQCAELKYNAFTMYTEHVFKLQKHPDLAPADGITADQVRELVAFAKPYHVEIIGNFQSFGHFHNILTTPGYEFLGDDDWSLSPAKEAAYKFLADAFKEVVPAYESKLFNINCDEVSIGKGESKALVDKIGLEGVYAQHINRVVDLLKPYDKTAMMWGDIAAQHPKIVPQLPKDLIVLSWGYGPEQSFDKAIEPFTTLGYQFWVCPGVSNWSRIYPDFATAVINISNYVRDGVKLGTNGMINTTWDDDGETLFNYHWYPLAWGAEVAWNPLPPAESKDEANDQREARRRQFDPAFEGCFYGVTNGGDAIVNTLWHLSTLRKNPVTGDMRDNAFWRDTFQVRDEDAPSLDPDNIQRLRDESGAVIASLESLRTAGLARRNLDTLDCALFAARRANFIARRDAAMANVREVASRDELIGPRARDELNSLADELTTLRDQFAKLWNNENRPWWLDKNVAKYDEEIQRLRQMPLRVVITPVDTTFVGSREVELAAVCAGGDIRYTLDESEPTEQSPRYNAPLRVTSTTKIRARHFVPGRGAAAKIDEATFRTFRFPATITTNLVTYEDNVPVKAFDGSLESFWWGNHRGGGGVATGDFFTITLAQPMTVNKIRAVTGQSDHREDHLHKGVLEVSTDSTNFEQAAEFKKGVAETDLKGKQVKAIRIRATQDQEYWLIIREVLLNDDVDHRR